MSGRDPTQARRIMSEHRIDDLAAAIIALTREVWVLQDRQAVLERLLEDHGVPSGAIDTFVPDEAMRADLDERRQALLDTVVTALSGDAD